MKSKLWQVFDELQKDNYAKDLSPKTIETYDYSLTRTLRELDARGISEPSGINDEFISGFKYKLRKANLQNESVNSFLKALRRYLNFSYQKGYIRSVPKVELIRLEEKIKPTLTMQEVKLILESCDLSVPSVMCILYLGTGIRSRTMCHIRVEDSDLEAQLLTCKVTKNRKILTLPLTNSLCDMLKAYIEKHNKIAGEWLFVNAIGRQFYQKPMYKTINSHYKSLGINCTGVHLLRHTFGKLMVMNKCDAFTLMHWFGHSKTEETKRYVNLFANELAKTVETFNPTANCKFV